MTVEQLIKKLKRMPQDAIITVINDALYVDGEYKATSVETYDCKTVTICTNYEKRIDNLEYKITFADTEEVAEQLKEKK